MIVFCIDPVGTVTACRINVMPNIAMISVTTNDSKYSRSVDLRGPAGVVTITFGSAGVCGVSSFIRF